MISCCLSVLVCCNTTALGNVSHGLDSEPYSSEIMFLHLICHRTITFCGGIVFQLNWSCLRAVDSCITYKQRRHAMPEQRLSLYSPSFTYKEELLCKTVYSSMILTTDAKTAVPSMEKLHGEASSPLPKHLPMLRPWVLLKALWVAAKNTLSRMIYIVCSFI